MYVLNTQESETTNQVPFEVVYGQQEHGNFFPGCRTGVVDKAYAENIISNNAVIPPITSVVTPTVTFVVPPDTSVTLPVTSVMTSAVTYVVLPVTLPVTSATPFHQLSLFWCHLSPLCRL